MSVNSINGPKGPEKPSSSWKSFKNLVGKIVGKKVTYSPPSVTSEASKAEVAIRSQAYKLKTPTATDNPDINGLMKKLNVSKDDLAKLNKPIQFAAEDSLPINMKLQEDFHLKITKENFNPDNLQFFSSSELGRFATESAGVEGDQKYETLHMILQELVSRDNGTSFAKNLVSQLSAKHPKMMNEFIQKSSTKDELTTRMDLLSKCCEHSDFVVLLLDTVNDLDVKNPYASEILNKCNANIRLSNNNEKTPLSSLISGLSIIAERTAANAPNFKGLVKTFFKQEAAFVAGVDALQTEGVSPDILNRIKILKDKFIRKDEYIEKAKMFGVESGKEQEWLNRETAHLQDRSGNNIFP